MKKFLILSTVFFILFLPVFSATVRLDEEYLKNKKSPFSMSFVGESIVSKAIKRSLKKEAPGRYKVKFKGYSLSSLQKGIFKYLEITGKNVMADEIEIPYINIKTVTDYNWIDYNNNPIVLKSDMEFDCALHLSEKSINDSLKKEHYQKVLRKINKKVFPIFTVTGVKVEIKNNKMYIIISYNFPLSPRDNDKTFVVSSKLKVVNNEIKPSDISFDSVYGNLPVQKVANLINMLNPMNFAIELIENNQGEIRIKEIKIDDDIVIINGKMYVKGENK